MGSGKPSVDLVRVFIPPLATLLAHAETRKGAPLTEREVIEVRDAGVCVMMRAAEAEAMVASRGFRDVVSETCWADWHRLRVQMTGNGCLPKTVLCILGGADLAANGASILDRPGIEHEARPADPRMETSFRASSSHVRPSLGPDDFAVIGRHATVLYVLGRNVTSAQAPDSARDMLDLGRRLLEAGGTAMKCESSGIAHSRSQWIGLASRRDSWASLRDAFVQLPIRSEEGVYTCGMHLLGKPDLIMSEALIESARGPAESPVAPVIRLFESFALYLLAECPVGAFGSGHTFRVAADSPRFRVVWEPCAGYAPDDFLWNPFGRWRFAALA